MAFKTASLRPVSRRAFSSRARYGLISTNSSGSVDTSSRSTNWYPGSSRLATRLRASRRRWYPHLGQTCRFASNSALKMDWPQPSHFCHNPSVRTFFSAGFGSISFSCRLNQDMYSLPPIIPDARHYTHYLCATPTLEHTAIALLCIGFCAAFPDREAAYALLASVTGVVRMPSKYCKCPVELFREHQAGKLVG